MNSKEKTTFKWITFVEKLVQSKIEKYNMIDGSLEKKEQLTEFFDVIIDILWANQTFKKSGTLTIVLRL